MLQLQDWCYSSATTLRPFFQQQNCWPAAQILPGWVRTARWKRANGTVAPSSSQFPLCWCFMATAERLGAVRTRGGKIQFIGLFRGLREACLDTLRFIHSFQTTLRLSAAFRQRASASASVRGGECLLSPAPRINRLKVTYSKVSLQFNGCSRLKQPPHRVQLNQDWLGSFHLTGFPKQLEWF